jgi:hypothetical protein
VRPFNKNLPHVKIEIEDGKASIEAMNYRGPACLKAVEEAQQTLGGGTVLAARAKPELKLAPTAAAQTTVQATAKRTS